jgi:hypothetical protein
LPNLGPSILNLSVCALSTAGITGSNTTESIDICLLCIILGFLSEVGETCALLGYLAEYGSNFLQTFRNRYPETSEGNYHYTLRDNPASGDLFFSISGSWFRTSAMIILTKIPTRCTLVFKSLKMYFILILLYMFRTPLCPSSGASHCCTCSLCSPCGVGLVVSSSLALLLL